MLRSNFYKVQNSLLKLSGNRHEIPGKDGPFLALNKIFVLRNEAFEPYLAHGINCAAQIGIDLVLNYSEYDDSLRYAEIPEDSDQILIWLNWDRISSDQIPRYFADNSLLSICSTDSKYFFVTPSKFSKHNQAFFHLQLAQIGWPIDRIITGVNSPNSGRGRIKLGYTREELDSISSLVGVQVSSNANPIRIRALIIDLDYTMYRGVFGEDSIEDVMPGAEHLKLHLELKRLKESGVLLCIASKNNLDDIELILKSSLTSVLKKEDFVIISGGWESKSNSIVGILKDLRFSENFVAFIDDNQRELFEVGRYFPNLICINGENPENLLKVLSSCLNYERSQNTKISKVRSKDIRAYRSRQELVTLDRSSDSLLFDLNTKLEASKPSNSEEFLRAMELFRKTNQFNLTLKRSKSEISEFESIQKKLVVASLRDDLSNSGIIAAVKYVEVDDLIELQEFSISCRALGRDVEKYLFRAILSTIDNEYEKLQIGVRFNSGPKNQPALDFVTHFFTKENSLYILNSDKLMLETSEWYHHFHEL